MAADWEDFGRRVLERFCEGDTEVGMFDVQKWGDPVYLVAPSESKERE